MDFERDLKSRGVARPRQAIFLPIVLALEILLYDLKLALRDGL